MNTPDSNDSERILYLEQIDIDTNTRLRVNLRKDNNGVEIQQKERSSSWIPSRSLGLVGASRITIHARRRGNPFERSEALAEVNGEEAMQAFWESKESVSVPGVFHRQPVTITFRFRPSHTSETIRVAIETLQTAMKDYELLMTESTEQCIGMAMDPFAKLAFGLARGIFELLKQQRRYDENVADLASGIEALLPFANKALEGALYEEEMLEGVIKRLYDLVEDTANFVIGYAKRGPAIRALISTISPKDHGKIKALHGGFGKLKEEFDRAVDVTVLAAVRKIEEADLLKRLNPVEAANYEEEHSCMEGTRMVVLEDIIAWATNPFGDETQSNGSNPDVYWLYSMPGLGKTSVANSLCDRLRQSGNLGGSFLCKHDNLDLREPKKVLPTLIFKLTRMWPPFRKLVAQVLLNEPQINPESTRGELLLKPLKLLKKHPPRPLVLVIDALDECGQPNARGPLLKSLMEACSLARWLRVIITSRPESDITSFFANHSVITRDLAEDDVGGDDIRLFTESRMASVASRRHLSFGWPGSARVTQIVERSRGLFIFVETLYQLVNVPEPEPLLAQVLSGESRGVNTPLNALYSTVITSRISRPTRALHSILRAIAAVSAHRPLCAETLAQLLNIEPRVVHSWVDELSSLLYRDKSIKHGIRVRHLSILEFLVGSTCPPEFQVDEKLANLELTRHCLKTLANELKFDICKLETSYLSNADIHDLDGRVEARISDALQYSCMHWSNHLCHDDDPVSMEITRLLDVFFAGSQPLYWIEVLSLMGRVPVAISALRLMKACFKKFEDRHQRLVEDALSFVLAFFTPISTSTPHIYISALPFMPMASILCKRAGVSFRDTMSVCMGRMESWPTPPGTWKEHTDHDHSVRWSSDGQNVASSSSEKTIQVWDIQTGAAVAQPLEGHTRSLNSIAYSPDGHSVVSGSSDSTIRIWDPRTGAAVGRPLSGHTGLVSSVAYSPNGMNIVSGSSDKTIRIWDAQTGAAVGQSLTGHTGLICSVAYSSNGRNVVSGSYDRTIRIWDAQTGAAVGEPLTGHTGWVFSVAYSPYSQHIASGSKDKTIRIWNAHTGAEVVKPLRGHTGLVSSVAYSPDGRNVVSGSYDKTIRIWDVQTGTAVGRPLKGHSEEVNSVAYSPDGQNIVSGSYDKTIRIWDAQTGVAVGEPLTGHIGYVLSVAYSPDGRNIISGSSDRTIRVWNAKTCMEKDVHGVISDSSNLANSHLSMNAFSGRPIPTPLLDSNGWVRGASELLFWVPEDCRNGLTCPAITTMPNTGRQRPVRIDFSHFQNGTLWTNVRGRNARGES